MFLYFVFFLLSLHFIMLLLIIKLKVFICIHFRECVRKVIWNALSVHRLFALPLPFPLSPIFFTLSLFVWIFVSLYFRVCVWQSLCAPDLLINFLIPGSVAVVVVVWFSLFISDFTIQINFQCCRAKYVEYINLLRVKKKSIALVGTLYAYIGSCTVSEMPHTGRTSDSRWKFM